jgi:hypothetical protein
MIYWVKPSNDEAKEVEPPQSTANAAHRAGKTSIAVTAVGVRSVIPLGHGRIVIARMGTHCTAACMAGVTITLRERGSGHSESQKRTQRDYSCLLFQIISPAF